jgi:hypothetical protein
MINRDDKARIDAMSIKELVVELRRLAVNVRTYNGENLEPGDAPDMEYCETVLLTKIGAI